MGSAFQQLCPRYSGTLTPTAPTAIRLWDTFTFYNMDKHVRQFCIMQHRKQEHKTVLGSDNKVLIE